ncbi:MAG: YtxH domain-containing protein [Acidobacteriota bacterium]
MASTNGNIRAAAFFIAGGVLGTGLALLFAPQSGRRTRRELRYLGAKALNKAESMQADVRYAVENWMDEFSEKLKDTINHGQEWTEATKHQAQEALEFGKEYIQKEIERFKQALS